MRKLLAQLVSITCIGMLFVVGTPVACAAIEQPRQSIVNAQPAADPDTNILQDAPDATAPTAVQPLAPPLVVSAIILSPDHLCLTRFLHPTKHNRAPPLT
jgi:hypothetical protein